MKKYIIVGLGNFGSSLAIKLTNAGNEVFGADSILSRVDAIQEKITSAAMLDCTDFNAIKSALPYKDSDCVIVAIGEDIGASILVNATFKQLNVKRIMSRVISETHQRVLEAIGITEFVHPEEETASRLTEVLSLTGAMDVYSLFDKHKVVEVKTVIKNRVSAKQVPEVYNDLTPKEEYERIEFMHAFKAEWRDRGAGRPTKKERRMIEKMKDDM